MRERSRARSWALQVLYAWEAHAGTTPERVLDQFLAERRIAIASLEYLRTLIRLATANMTAIDRAVSGALTNWRLERLSVIDRNVLRIAATEMLFVSDVPPRVSIQEAIVLAEKYGTRESPRFVNGVLDALMRQTGGVANGGAAS